MKKCVLIVFVILYSFCVSFTAWAETDIKTPKESEIIKNLQKKCVVFLCFYKPSVLNFDAIKANLQSIADNFKGSVDVIYVSGDDKKEDKLREKFMITSEMTVAFIVVPPGIARARIEGTDITKANLMRALFAACGGGTCGSSCK